MKKIIFSILILFVMFGCEPSDGSPVGEKSHTFVMYMIAENNLSGLLRGNVNMAMMAVRRGLPKNSRVLVYWDGYTSTQLTELVVSNGIVVERILKEYLAQNSVDSEVMKAVLEDVKSFAPADVYGIALGSHATGWFPPELNNLQRPMSVGDEGVEHDLMKPEGALTRAFGADMTNYMSIPNLVKGLSAIDFDYIITDACFMSSVEALYDLRYSADYIVASPVEVMGEGLPYQNILLPLFNRKQSLESRLVALATEVVDYYRTQQYPSSAFTVIKTSRIDAMAEAAKRVYATGLDNIDISTVQSLERIYPDHAFFDMNDYLSKAIVSGNADAKTALAALERAMDDMIIYEGHTPKIYSAFGGGGFFDVERFCGISTYIPRDKFPVTKQAYYDSAWGKYTQPTVEEVSR